MIKLSSEENNVFVCFDVLQSCQFRILPSEWQRLDMLQKAMLPSKNKLSNKDSFKIMTLKIRRIMAELLEPWVAITLTK